MPRLMTRRSNKTYQWQTRPAWPLSSQMAKQLSTSPLIAQLLYNRGISDVAEARKFLSPSLNDLVEPQRMGGIAPAVKRIQQALQNSEKIVLYGDYDVDGITGVSILWHCFQLSGTDVEYYVPHRINEGYGLNPDAIKKLADKGTQLIITVDCGITACAEAKLAADLGIDLIITDHHTKDAQLPQACAIVHPDLDGQNYPNKNLCGAAVAFKLAWALAQKLSGTQKVSPEFRDYLINATALVALGTIADVVPLTGENRILANFGLQGLAASKDTGIAALINACGLNGEKLDSADIGFKLAPRLNAAGRMGHARLAVELFTKAGPAKAAEIATYLEQQNRLRQKIEKQITEQAVEQMKTLGFDPAQQRSIVLTGETWHGGVVGIVASRIVDKFNCPTIILSTDNGIAKGSGRSVPGFDLYTAISACSEHLEAFGGHTMAAGLTLKIENIEPFRHAFNAYARSVTIEEDLTAKLDIDAEVALTDLDLATAQSIQRLAPFGAGNPQVLLVARGIKLVGKPRTMGKKADHLQMTVAAAENDEPHMTPGGMMRVVAFGKAKWEKKLIDAESFDLAFEPHINHFNGNTTVEMIARDIIFH